jgi:HAMP domain-containing protein
VTISTSGDEGLYYGNRPFVKQAAAGGRYTSPPSRENGQEVVYYSAPVRDSKGGVVKAAVIVVDAESLWEPLREESAHRGPGSVAILTDEYGVRIGHGTDETLVYKAWAPLPDETIDALLEEQHYGEDIKVIEATGYPDILAVIQGKSTGDTFVHRLEISDETYESAFSRIPGTGWTVMTAIPHSSFLGSLASLRKGMELIIILTALIVTVITLVAGRFVSRPVRRLVSSTRRMAEGDFSTPVPHIHDREMGPLADEFNRMRKKVAETYEELERGYLDMARALVASLEARDHYTAGHTERVGQYAVSMARRLGMDDEETARLKKAADLHDIGKIGVSDSVLLKPAKLSPEEFAEIKRHPGKSGEIVNYLGFLRDVVPIVEGHHERYDGNGYPRGLRGENIPRGARILAVADAYDAMTSSRAYRNAMDHDVATDRLKEGAGSQWDPEIVAAFLEMIEDATGEG